MKGIISKERNMRFGHCKNCYWWNRCSSNKGICFMHTQSEDIKTLQDSYCPDFVNRKKYEKESGMTLKEWTEQNEFNGRYVNYIELCGTELKAFITH